jgi:hypothetical protein
MPGSLDCGVVPLTINVPNVILNCKVGIESFTVRSAGLPVPVRS